MSPSEMEAYVRQRWVVSLILAGLKTDKAVCISGQNPIWGDSMAEAWSAAYAFTLEHEEKIRQKREEIEVLKGDFCPDRQCLKCDARKRILAVLNEQLESLLRGWKGEQS